VAFGTRVVLSGQKPWTVILSGLVVVLFRAPPGWHGSGADCSEAEEEESIYSEEESGSEAADDF
jgi:hypothetical protein